MHFKRAMFIAALSVPYVLLLTICSVMMLPHVSILDWRELITLISSAELFPELLYAVSANKTSAFNISSARSFWYCWLQLGQNSHSPPKAWGSIVHFFSSAQRIHWSKIDKQNPLNHRGTSRSQTSGFLALLSPPPHAVNKANTWCWWGLQSLLLFQET